MTTTGLTFTARVVGLRSASEFTDDRPRVVLKLDDCDWLQSTLQIPLPAADLVSDYHVDDLFEVTIAPKEPTN